MRDDLYLARRRAETPTDPDLDNRAETALREMIVLLVEKANLSREGA